MSNILSFVWSLSLLLFCFSVYTEAGYGKPEPPPTTPDENDIDVEADTKTCSMTCRAVRQGAGGKDWKVDSFWTVINSGYTCRMQRFGKQLLENEKYCDLFINSFDPVANITRYYCTHAGILSLVSDPLRRDVAAAIERHVRDVTRDRDRLPSYDWPPLEKIVIDSILEYIYTYRMTKWDASQHNIFALYVGSFFAHLPELMKLIETYLEQSFDVVEQLNQLVYYLRWAHDRGFLQLKEKLMDIAKKILRMDDEKFAQFIRDICEPNGYYRSGGPSVPILPLGDRNFADGRQNLGGPGFTGATNIIDEIRDRYNRTSYDVNINRPGAPYDANPNLSK